MDYTVGGILQARIQERVAIPICFVFIMENCWTCISNLHQVFVAINSAHPYAQSFPSARSFETRGLSEELIDSICREKLLLPI